MDFHGFKWNQWQLGDKIRYEMPRFQWTVQDPRIESAPRSFLLFGPALSLWSFGHQFPTEEGLACSCTSSGAEYPDSEHWTPDIRSWVAEENERQLFWLQVFMKVQTGHCKGRVNTLYKHNHPRCHLHLSLFDFSKYIQWTWMDFKAGFRICFYDFDLSFCSHYCYH